MQTTELSKMKKKRRKSPSKKTKRQFCKYWIHIEDEQQISLNNLKGIAGEQMVLRWLTERRMVGEQCYGEYGLYQRKQKVVEVLRVCMCFCFDIYRFSEYVFSRNKAYIKY
jgi:hypothetical protein